MKFTRETTTALMIHSVGNDSIRIGSESFDHAIALSASTVPERWPDKDIGDLVEQDFEALLHRNPEVVVLGTGSELVFPPRQLVFAMARRGVGFEAMNTAAAARTFNVLAGEGREVAAVLYV